MKRSKSKSSSRIAKPPSTTVKSKFVQRKFSEYTRQGAKKDAVPNRELVEVVDLKAPPLPRELPTVEVAAEETKSEELQLPERIKELLADKEKTIEMLKAFDLNYSWGPCVGLTRSERWERAKKLELEPPEDIGLLLSTSLAKDDPDIREALWYQTL
ncbi:hypothetical protein HK104_003423 [Borealophlyctis nickersoniae]|nr:hypothetical protein HK104_003423 [Borealophlyctis nickersoniae]